MSALHAPNALHDALASARLLPAIAPQREAEVRAWADACIDAKVPALELLLRGDKLVGKGLFLERRVSVLGFVWHNWYVVLGS